MNTRRSRFPTFAWLSLAAASLLSISGCGGGGSDEPAPANSAPTVAISAPAQNATFAAGATIVLTATAADSDGTVSKVEFFNGTTKLGEDTSAPFEFSWTNAAPNSTYTITARATDNSGAVAVSASRTISVGAVPNVAPTVAILAPANNFKTNAPATVTWSAQADDSDGTVASVEFFAINPAAPVYDATTRLGAGTKQGNTSAYELQTANVAAGTYTVVARATDDDGDIATSASVQVVVNALPAITFDAPPNGTIFLPGANLTLKATASDADGSIAKVEFFADGSATPLGQGTKGLFSATYELTWNGVPAGPHTIEAVATDNDGATQRVSITIGEDQPPAVTLATPQASTNAPATITLTATATDADGTIASVTFKNNGVSVGAGVQQGSTNVYQLVLSNQAAGSYAFTATATDNIGAAFTTRSQNVNVLPNVPPTVSVTSPASFALPAVVTLTATAADSDGIAKVEFYVDDNPVPVGEDSIAPYAVTWTVPAGDRGATHTVKAKAIDTVGSATMSASVNFEATPDPAGMWDTLSPAQQAGITLTPNRLIVPASPGVYDGGVHAGAVMTAIGVNTVASKYVVAMAQGLRKLADLPDLTLDPNYVPATYVPCGPLPEDGRYMMQPVPDPLNPGQFKPGEFFVNYKGPDEDQFKGCKIGGFSFHGGADVAPYIQTYDPLLPETCPPPPATNQVDATHCRWPSVVTYKKLAPNQFRIVVSSVTVSGNGTPEPSTGPFPHNAYGYAWVECTVTNGVKSCLTSHENSFLWGNDLAWTDWSPNGTAYPAFDWNLYATDDSYTLNGTLRQCQPDPQPENETPQFCVAPSTAPAGYHIKFDNMKVKTPSLGDYSGRAIVYGSDGWVVVTRQAPDSPGVERVTVQRTVGGVAGPVQPFRCTVDPNGFYQCVLVP